MAASRPYLAAGLGFAIQIAIVFSPSIFAGRTILPTDFFIQAHLPFSEEKAPFAPYNHFEVDIMNFYVPYKLAAKEHLYQPYWNPHNFGGIPQYANTYAAHFSTLQWMLKFGPVEKVVPFQLATFLWIAGMGMFFLLRTLGVGWGSAYLFSTAYSLNGLFITLLLRGWLLGAFAWVPAWVAHCVKLTRRLSPRNFAFASLFLGFTFLDGFFQSSAFAALILGAFFLVHAAFAEKKIGARLKWIGIAAAIFGLAFAVSAISWLPALEYLREDIAKGGSRMTGGDFGKNWVQRILSLVFLPGLFIPEALGSVRTLDLTKLIKTHLQDFSAYLGMVVPVFALAAFFVRDLRKDPEFRIFFFLCILGIVLPVFTFFDRYFYFRFLIVYAFGATVVGAVACDRWMSGAKNLVFPVVRSARLFSILFGAWLFSWIVVAVTLAFRGDWLRGFFRGEVMSRVGQSAFGVRFSDWMASRSDLFLDRFTMVSPVLWCPLLGFVILLLVLKGKLGSSWRLPILSVLTFFQLALFAWQWLPANRVSEYPLYPANEVVDILRDGGRYLVYGADSSRRTILPFNSASAYRLYDFAGFDGLKPYTAFQLMGADSDPSQFGVRNFVTYRDVTMDPKRFKFRYEGRVRIYESLSYASIGQVFTQYRNVGSRQESVKWTQERGLGGSEIAVEEDLPFPSRSNTEKAVVHRGEASDNSVSYEVETTGSGLFVLSETWYPGWKVFIDGAESKLLRVAGALRGTVLSAGRHRVEFRFEPSIYRIGRFLTLMALGIVAFLIFFGRRRERMVA